MTTPKPLTAAELDKLRVYVRRNLRVSGDALFPLETWLENTRRFLATIDALQSLLSAKDEALKAAYCTIGVIAGHSQAKLLDELEEAMALTVEGLKVEGTE